MTWIKKAYLYLVALISLVIMVIGSIQLLNLALKQWVFTKADQDFYITSPTKADCQAMTADARKTLPECTDPNWAAREEQRQKDVRTAQKQRDAATAIAMIIVGTPVFIGHIRWAKKESEEQTKQA